jgi:hypothetical protein
MIGLSAACTENTKQLKTINIAIANKIDFLLNIIIIPPFKI